MSSKNNFSSAGFESSQMMDAILDTVLSEAIEQNEESEILTIETIETKQPSIPREESEAVEVEAEAEVTPPSSPADHPVAPCSR